MTNTIIAGGKFDVNSSKYLEGSTFKKPGEISIIPNQPEARLIESSDRPLSKVTLETNHIP